MTSTPSESAGPTPSPRSNGPGRLPPEKAAPRKPSALRSSAPDSTAPPARRLGPTLVVAGCLVLIFGVYWWLAAQLAAFHSVWSPDCGARLIQVQAVLQHWPHWWVSYPAQN